jgi:hypothetical protein
VKVLLRPVCWLVGHVEEHEDEIESGVCLCRRCGKFLWVVIG